MSYRRFDPNRDLDSQTEQRMHCGTNESMRGRMRRNLYVAVIIAGLGAIVEAQVSDRLDAVARARARRGHRVVYAAGDLAGCARQALEGRGRHGLRDADSGRQPRLLVFARLNNQETMQALDAASGKVLWRAVSGGLHDALAPPRTRGRPQVDAGLLQHGRLYSIGMTGIVTAWDAASGKQLWQKPGVPSRADVHHALVLADRRAGNR